MFFSFLMMLAPSMLNINTPDGMAPGNVTYAATHKQQLLSGELEGHTESIPEPLISYSWSVGSTPIHSG